MEEMGKAKARAEEERDIYKHMLEQGHERSLKERQELRRDAQSKLEASAVRMRAKKQRVQQLEKELRERSQVEEEKNAYREQCQVLMEQCQSLMEQLSAAHGGDRPLQLPPPQSPRGNAGGQVGHAPTSLLERVRSGVRSGMAAAAAASADRVPARESETPGSGQ